jgi:sodium-dependent dicarboxylate transporter 2/3/5
MDGQAGVGGEAPKRWLTPARAVLLALPVLFIIYQEIWPIWPEAPGKGRALGLLLMMALWWVTETLPLHWTSLLPLAMAAFFPMLLDPKKGTLLPLGEQFVDVAIPYFNPYIRIFAGGMLIGVAMEAHNLHRRIALNIMKLIGSSPKKILLGFTVATAFISLWISNTATAVMMVPIALAVISQLEAREGRRLPLLGQSIMLAVAYGANVGGIGTLIGTPPNMALAGFVEKTYDQPMNFGTFLLVGLPFVILFLPLVYGILLFVMRKEQVSTVESDVIDGELAKLGSMSSMEKRVAGVFIFTSLMWIFSQPIQALLQGQVGRLGWKLKIDGAELDAFFALLAPALLVILGPLRLSGFKRMPWDILILLGGSYVLAQIVSRSDLAAQMVELLRPATRLHPFLLMLVVCTATIVLTAFSANTASASLMMLLVVSTLDHKHINPAGTLPFLYGAAISSSCDFMLPCGTPPNAIVFGTRYVSIRAMATTGFLLDVAAGLLCAAWIWFAARHFM